jgi:type II secretion system protein H
MKDGHAGAATRRRMRSRSSFSIQHSAFSISPSRSGFTLIELIVVMLVLAILFGAIAPALSGFGAGREAKHVASQIVTLARWAREQAISEGRTFRLSFDTSRQAYWVTAENGAVFQPLGVEFGRIFTWPETVAVTFDTPQADGLPCLEFLPSGRSQPGRIRVTSRSGDMTELASLSATEPLRVVSAEELAEVGLQ